MSKFGVYLSIFYMKVDGQKCELSTANKLPYTQPFARPRAKLSVKGNHEHSILRYMAYIRVIPTYSLHKWDLWRQLTCFLGLLKSGTVLETKSSSQFHMLATWSFQCFLKKKHSSLYTPQMALSNHLMVYKSLPRHSNVLPSFVFSYF